MMKKLVGGRLWLLLVVLFSGCDTTPQSDYGAVDLVPATGTITLDGKPLAGAVVTFDAEDGQFSYGLADDSGHYQLHFDTVKKGVTPGKKVIRISTKRKILGLNTEEEGGGEGDGEGEEKSDKQPPATELVPDKFNSQSQLTEKVTLDQTIYNFDLQSK